MPNSWGNKKVQPLKNRAGAGLKILSFFTGAGGLDLGFEQAGFETIYATDIDPRSCETLKMNRGTFLSRGMKVEHGDICSLDPATLARPVDLVIGGPPCQSFSASGRRAGGASGRLDRRGQLFESYCRVINAIRPKAFVFENVRGILGTNKGLDWQAVIAAFQKINYRISFRLLDALDYGAPQQRERLFLVGHQLNGEFLFPQPTHGPDSKKKNPHVAAEEALAGIEEDEDLLSLELAGGKYSHLLPEVPPGQNYLFFTAKRGYPKPIFAYRSRFSDFLYKAAPDAPIKTLIARPGKYTGPLHWENRYFSVREYMRLQGFPDGYRFSGSRDDAIRQIGNSVSPKIAYQIALAIAGQIFERDVELELLPHDCQLSFDARKSLKAMRTRQLHDRVAQKRAVKAAEFFHLKSYITTIEPLGPSAATNNVVASTRGGTVKLKVCTESTEKLFARMRLAISDRPISQSGMLPGILEPQDMVILEVEAYGSEPFTIQTMWNAVDDWVVQSSNFHSLFELYGHFTEPHPLFAVESFEIFSDHPIAEFAKHASNFSNCSRYVPKEHLIELFGKTLRTRDFVKIASYLRGFRFDIRSRETNVAIDESLYMVAYPFALPTRKQMNFRLQKKPRSFIFEQETTSPAWL